MENNMRGFLEWKKIQKIKFKSDKAREKEISRGLNVKLREKRFVLFLN